MSDHENLTQLLILADHGDQDAANELFLMVESDLRAIAANRKREHSSPECTTLGLVHEAWIRLVGKQQVEWQPGDRRKFFGYISRKTHDILIEKARKKRLLDRHSLPEEQIDHSDSPLKEWEFLEDLKSKLEEFRTFAEDDAAIFEIRYFLRSTFDEIAAMIGKKPTSVKMSYYRAERWLQHHLKDYRKDS